jgi:hypothetical protein
MLENVATEWPLSCPECGKRVTIELAHDAEAGTGIQTCPNGHDFSFYYDGFSVGRLSLLGGRV